MKANKKSASAPLLNPDYSLMFFNGQFVWRSRTARGDAYKFVSPAAVLQAFKDEPVDTGWLAPNVMRCGGSARGDFAVLSIPARRHALNVEQTKGGGVVALDVWLPSLVFFGHGAQYFVWAIKSAEAQPTSALYHAPLPNVFASGGICWGQNSAPRASAATITQAWELFITSPFNGHAAGGKSATKAHAADVRTLLRQVARSRRKFPTGELVAARSYGNTLDGTINGLLGGAGE